MSVTASVDLKGSFNKNLSLLDLLSSIELSKKVIFDNELIIGRYEDDDFVDSIYLSVDFKEEKEVFNFLKKYDNLASFYLGLKIKEEYHYFTFYFSKEGSISFTIDGNRKTVDSRYTDFSWYFDNFIKELVGSNFKIEAVTYSDE